VISRTVFFDAASRRHNNVIFTCLQFLLIMASSNEDKILIKNLQIQKGTGGTAPKKLMKVS